MTTRTMRWGVLPGCCLAVLSGCSGTTTQDELDWVDQAVVACAAGPTVRGVDVSVYQGSVNWGAVHAAGWDFAVTRIGDGYGGDSTFQTNWQGIKAAGMIRGAYQFWRASNDQVRMADIVVNAVGRLGPGDLPVMLDIEGASMQGQSPGTIQSQMNIWLARVEAGTGKKPLIYTGKYAWDPSVQSTAYGSYPLWIAAYGANTGGVPTQCPNTPNGWSTWAFWQYTSVGTIPGIGTNVDKNLFNGTLAQLQTLANGLSDDNCFSNEVQGCGNFGCGCVDHACNGVFCAGSGCTAQHTANCGAFGAGCADGQCSGGTAPGSGCTAKETLDCSKFGCGCVDHKCNGGAACPGTGCTWRETHDCAGFGVNCADHKCSGGYGPGNGCTGKETTDCTAKGCSCVDHVCSGGSACAGSGSTARNALDCGNFGCHSVDGQCSGGYCPGTGCTAKQTADCNAKGCGCADEVCGGGACMGTGCTVKQTNDCQKVGATCSRGACITDAGTTVVVDGGQPKPAPEDGGLPTMPDGGFGAVDAGDPVDAGGPGEVDPGPADGGGLTMGGGGVPMAGQPPEDPRQILSTSQPASGGCSAAPGGVGLGLLLAAALRRRRTQ